MLNYINDVLDFLLYGRKNINTLFLKGNVYVTKKNFSYFSVQTSKETYSDEVIEETIVKSNEILLILSNFHKNPPALTRPEDYRIAYIPSIGLQFPIHVKQLKKVCV